MTMTSRRWLVAVICAVSLIGLVGTLYVFRGRLMPRRDDHAAMNMGTEPGAPASSSQAGVPARGDVSIDPQRQQLIGVRLATVTREPIARSLRTTGVVRYDETR